MELHISCSLFYSHDLPLNHIIQYVFKLGVTMSNQQKILIANDVTCGSCGIPTEFWHRSI